jgi:hypothetical protein
MSSVVERSIKAIELQNVLKRVDALEQQVRPSDEG